MRIFLHARRLSTSWTGSHGVLRVCGLALLLLFCVTAARTATAQPVLQPAPAVVTSCEVRDPDLQGLYTGDCMNGRAHGRGRVLAGKPGQGSYEGEFRYGFAHGQGRKQFPNGDVYEGQWIDGVMNISGRYDFGPGSPWHGDRYEGQWLDGVRQGMGRYTWVFGDVYEGVWEQNLPKGESTSGQLHRRRFLKVLLPRLRQDPLNVCSTLTPGASPSWMIRGEILEFHDDRVKVRIRQQSSVESWQWGTPRWEPIFYWLPCATPSPRR